MMAPSGRAFISDLTTVRCSSDVPGGVCVRGYRVKKDARSTEEIIILLYKHDVF